MSTRISQSNTEDFIKGKILDSAIDKIPQSTRTFYYGIVINNNDPLNANRIKVRVPFLDDKYYIERQQKDADELLPWCIPFSRNFISTPEHNSIVLVAVMDVSVPYFGRIYFDSLTDLTDKEIFDFNRLTPETKTYNNWANAERASNIGLGAKPKEANKYNTKESIKYRLGIKGKGKNRLTFLEEETFIVQNEKTKKESYLKLAESSTLESSNELFLLSKKGRKKYHPVFDEPLYKYLGEMNGVIKDIITTLNTQPSLNSINMSPNLPSPSSIKLVLKLQSMLNKFQTFKQPGEGSSKYLYIN